MVHEFKLSDIGDDVDEAEILKWMVSEGDSVREDDPLMEIETERAIIEIPSPVGGKVSRIHAEAGETVPVGATVATLDTEEDGEERREEEDVEILDSEGNATVDVDAEGTEEEPMVEGEVEDNVLASPSTRLLAREVGVDIEEVEGSGADGRVVAQDVLRAAREKQEEREASDGRGADATKSLTEEGEDEGRSDATRSPPDTEEEEGISKDDGSGDDDGNGEDMSTEFGGVGTATVDPEKTEETTMFEGEEETEEAEEGTTKEKEEDEDPSAEKEEAGARVEEAAEVDVGETDDYGAVEENSTRETNKTKTEGAEAFDEADVVPYSGTRRRVGERLREAAEGPLVTHHCTADAERLVEVRERLRGEVGARLTYTPFLVKACGVALEDHRLFNSELDTDAGEIRLHDEVNIGVATETDECLRFLVVKNVGEKGVAEIAGDINDLTGRTEGTEQAHDRMRADDLPDETDESTFTVYNIGAVGGEGTTPLPNHPETAAVAVGEIRERPRVVEGKVVPRQTVPLSLTFDHRVSNTAAAARFTEDLKRYLNDPMEMLL